MSSPGDPPRELAPVPPGATRPSGWIDCWRFWAPVVAVLALVAWRGADAWIGAAPGPQWHNPGRLAAAHAGLEADCAACHTPFASVRGGHAFDARCAGCHSDAPHHTAAADPPGCSACHHEHRGRETSLARVADRQCIRCHADLKNHMAGGAAARFENVSGFDPERHPEFAFRREKRADPGALKFNHRLHMAPGLRGGEGGAVQLDCGACHRTDAGDIKTAPERLAGVPVRAVLPARAGGAAMLPVVYELHCQSCHPLTFDRTDPNDPRTGAFAVPHRLQPDRLRGYLLAHNARALAAAPQPAAALPLPGGGDKAPDTPAKRLARAEHDLFHSGKGCGECHHWTRPGGSLPPERWSELRVAPTGVKQVWLEHAAFDHTRHRQLECRACHAGAYEWAAPGVPGSADSRDVLLPGVATCMSCHGPPPGVAARGSCVECHKYHNGDHPLAGRGAGAPAGARTIADFLRRPR